jgi:hypothetical protein
MLSPRNNSSSSNNSSHLYQSNNNNNDNNNNNNSVNGKENNGLTVNTGPATDVLVFVALPACIFAFCFGFANAILFWLDL